MYDFAAQSGARRVERTLVFEMSARMVAAVVVGLEDFEAGIERYKVLWAGIDLLREQIAAE